MGKEMLISSSRHETKVAILEDDQLVEIYFQRADEYSLAGSIHKGRVTRVLPGMQSAFVNLGLERDAFLYVSDFFEENEEYDKIASGVEDKVLEAERIRLSAPVQRPPVIETPVMPGVEVRETKPLETRPVEHPRLHEHRPPEGGRPEDGDRDRRGRRSRRRRFRGRGFPDSKYAGAPGAPEAPPAEEPPVAELAEHHEPLEEAIEEEFPVLPGESLAKYTRKGEGELAEESDDEPITLAGDEEVLPEVEEDEPGPELLAEIPDQLIPEIEVGANGDTESETVDEAAVEEEAVVGTAAVEPAGQAEPEVSEVAGAAPEETESSAWDRGPRRRDSRRSRAAARTAAAAKMREEAREAQAGAPAPAESAPKVVAETTPASVEPVAETPAVAENVAADKEPGEAPHEVTGDVPPRSAGSIATAEVPAENSAEQVPGELDEVEETADAEEAVGEAGDEEGPEPARKPQSLTAVLREQEPRYLQQRTSRRLRRKMRKFGDRGPEDRPAAAAPPPPPPAAPDVRAEASRPQAREAQARPDRERAPQPSITELLREGQEILVQIAKEPLGQKGARITSHIALPGRYCVYMPTVDHMGVSRKIASDDERLRLKRILQAHRAGIPGGFIVRTAGEGKTEDQIADDMMFLYNLWLDIRQKAESRPAPALIHHDLDLTQRLLRDQLNVTFKNVWVDNEEIYESVLRFVQRFQPALVGRVRLYTRKEPIFDAFSVTAELEKALHPKVWLKSGGYIVINQTEALVAIDVNTGKFVGKSNRLEDTIVKTNTEAVKEIVRQLRLRDLGGIIVVDFIDMDERKNRQKVMQTLEEAMRSDRAPYKILQFNDFGLVAITRKRVKQSLERTLCAPCPYCEGAGYVKSVETVVGEILQEAVKIAPALEGKDAVLRVNPEVAKVFKSHQNKCLEELEEVVKRPVLVKSDPQLHQEKYDLA